MQKLDEKTLYDALLKNPEAASYLPLNMLFKLLYDNIGLSKIEFNVSKRNQFERKLVGNFVVRYPSLKYRTIGYILTGDEYNKIFMERLYMINFDMKLKFGTNCYQNPVELTTDYTNINHMDINAVTTITIPKEPDVIVDVVGKEIFKVNKINFEIKQFNQNNLRQHDVIHMMHIIINIMRGGFIVAMGGFLFSLLVAWFLDVTMKM